jgi:hypothetical protein
VPAWFIDIGGGMLAAIDGVCRLLATPDADEVSGGAAGCGGVAARGSVVVTGAVLVAAGTVMSGIGAVPVATLGTGVGDGGLPGKVVSDKRGAVSTGVGAGAAAVELACGVGGLMPCDPAGSGTLPDEAAGVCAGTGGGGFPCGAGAGDGDIAVGPAVCVMPRSGKGDVCPGVAGRLAVAGSSGVGAGGAAGGDGAAALPGVAGGSSPAAGPTNKAMIRSRTSGARTNPPICDGSACKSVLTSPSGCENSAVMRS